MKKSVILLIALIYAAALLFVGFLGRNPKVFEEVIPVERVEITNREMAVHSIFGRYVTITPDAKGRMQYQLVKVDGENIQPIFKDSGAIFSLSTADGYVKIPKLVELVDEGEEVEVYLFN